MCHKDKKDLKGTAALEYINWGESQGFHERPSCAGRARWWDVGKQETFDCIILRFRDKRNWSPINIIPSMLAGDIMFIAKWTNRQYVDVTNALANCTLSIMISEIYGRINLGDGLLTTYGPEIIKFDFLDPSIFKDIIELELISALKSINKRDVLPVFDELKMIDRHALDAIVFDALGLTQTERDAVYEAVINLVESRLKKAGSV